MSKEKVCPYCKAKIDYSHRRKAVREKCNKITCIKCGKVMSISYKKSAVLMGIFFFFASIALNTFYLFFTKNQTIIPNFVLTSAIIILYAVLVPNIVRFGKIAGQEDELPKLKKNRHRHKKDKNSKIEFDENPLKNTTFDK